MSGVLDLLGVSPPDAELKKALVAGTLSFIGVLITGFVAIATWLGNKIFERQQERAHRRQAQRDLETALLAEIDAVWRQWVVAEPGPNAIAALKARFAGDPAYLPFVTSETGVAVFPALIQQIPVLDETEIACIIRFYRQIRLIDAFASEIRSAAFAGLATPRREAILTHYLTMIEAAVLMAEEAIMTIEPILGIPEPLRLPKRKADLFNNKEADRTAPASEAADRAV